MRIFAAIFILVLLMGCDSNEVSYVSIRNDMPVPIYAIPYSSDYADGDWINPGVIDEFYSISINHLDGFEYFLAYYDSLIVYIKDHEKHPVKFYPDGTTINYNPELNPFINPDVWEIRIFNSFLRDATHQGLEETRVYEDYFNIEAEQVISLSETHY